MKFRIGDEIKILPGAVYADSSNAVPDNAINTKLFVRDVDGDVCKIGRAMKGPYLGLVNTKFIKLMIENNAVIDPYIVQVVEANLPIYHSPSKTSGIVRRVDNTALFVIVDERNGFGKLQMGAGWVELAKVKSFKK